MKAQQNTINTVQISKVIGTVIAAIHLLSFITGAQAASNYQHNALFNPSQFQLQAEDNGRVMLYDRLDNETVELAMTEQFDRIESMMFVRTRYIQEDGSVGESDDCD